MLSTPTSYDLSLKYDLTSFPDVVMRSVGVNPFALTPHAIRYYPRIILKPCRQEYKSLLAADPGWISSVGF